MKLSIVLALMGMVAGLSACGVKGDLTYDGKYAPSAGGRSVSEIPDSNELPGEL